MLKKLEKLARFSGGTKMDQITHEMRLKNWKHVVEECNNRPQGTTVKEWLTINGIKEKTYYYWLRRVRQAIYDQMRCEQTGELSIAPNNKLSYAEITLNGNINFGTSRTLTLTLNVCGI